MELQVSTFRFILEGVKYLTSLIIKMIVFNSIDQVLWLFLWNKVA